MNKSKSNAMQSTNATPQAPEDSHDWLGLRRFHNAEVREKLEALSTATEASQPKPAPGQIWHARYGQLRTVTAVEASGAVGYEINGTAACLRPIAEFVKDSECIGVETPLGRVLVGEQRRPPGIKKIATVVRIGDSITIGGVTVSMMHVKFDGSKQEVQYDARQVAGWPLANTKALQQESLDEARKHIHKPLSAEPLTLGTWAAQEEKKLRDEFLSEFPALSEYVNRPAPAGCAAIETTTAAPIAKPSAPTTAEIKSEIDALIRGLDLPRRAAIMAAYEPPNGAKHPHHVPHFLKAIDAYDAARKKGMSISRAMQEGEAACEVLVVDTALVVFERLRRGE